MSLTSEQKTLVQTSFAAITDPDLVAQTFYTRLFETTPQVRYMFTHDMAEQGKKLMKMLAVAVHSLDHLDTLIPAVQALGERHVQYGVQKEHYDIVGAELLWTFEHLLGEAFTPELKDAWATAYGVLAGVATSAYATGEAIHDAM